MKRDLRCRMVIAYLDKRNMLETRKISQDHILTLARFLQMEVTPKLFEQLSEPILTEDGKVVYFDCYYLYRKDLLTETRRELKSFLRLTAKMMALSGFFLDCAYEGSPYKMNFSYK